MTLRRHAHPLFDHPRGAWGPALTDDAVRADQAALGLRLPATLLDALRATNGGRLRRTRFSAVQASSRFPGGVRVRDLSGVGYPEGVRLSPALVREWEYPDPSVVLSSEGPQAVLLDYRRCGPHGEPAVVFVDTDHEVDGRAAEWTLALDFATFAAGLAYAPGRAQVALPAGPTLDAVLDALRAAGGEGPAHEDYEEGRTVAVPALDSREPGVTRLRVVPLARPDRTRWFPELPDHDWLVETTAVAGAATGLLGRVAAALGVEPLLLAD